MDRSLAPVLDACLGVGLNGFADLTDFGVSAGGFERRPVNLLTEEECDRLVVGLCTSIGVGSIAGAAWRGESGA